MPFLYGRKIKKLFSYILAVFLVLTFTGRVFAQQKPNIHVGTLEFHPFNSVKQMYDSNIYLESKGDENDDFITDITIGVRAQMPLIPQRKRDFMLKTSYQADIIEFWRHNQNDRVDHTLRGLLDFTFTNDFRLKIEENFKKTADPPNSERTSLDKRFRNILDMILVYDREKIRFEGGYRMVRDDYDDSNNLDKTDNMFTAAYFYQIFPKISMLAEYNFGIIEYDSNQTNSDSKYHQGRLGVVGNLWPKLTGTVKAGYRYVGYDESNRNDFSSFTLFGNIKYTATERTVMNLYADRTSQESSYSAISYYEVNKIEIKLDHQLLERFWFDGGSFFQYSRYPAETTEGSDTAKRKDILWGVGTGTKYEIKEWWIIKTDYEFRQRDSNFAVYDYNDHKISASVEVMF